MAVPVGEKVEIEFTAGVWTDVTVDVDWSQGVSISMGRTDPNGTAQTGALTCRLRNPLGKYTPGSQVLKDGTANSLYPNVQIRKRIRYSWTVSAVQKIRFLGYIKDWSPQLENGILAYVPIIANDRLDRFQRVTLDDAMLSTALADGAVAAYTMGDAAGATTVAPSVGSSSLTQNSNGSGGSATFGVDGADPEQRTGLQLANVDTNNGVWFNGASGYRGVCTSLSVEIWCKLTTIPPSNSAALGGCADIPHVLDLSLFISTSGYATVQGMGTFAIGSTNLCDGLWHQLVGSYSAAGTLSLYVDGALISTASPAANLLISPSVVYLGQGAPSSYASCILTGSINCFFQYPTALTAAQVLKHYKSRMGVAGDKTGTRIARYLDYAGVPSAEYSIMTGQQTVGSHQLLGTRKKLADAADELAATESGGAAFYVLPTGITRFADSSYRSPTSPVVSFDAQADLVYPGWQPAWDDSTLVNYSNLTRENGNPVTYVNTASYTSFDEFDDPNAGTVCTDTDQAALNIAAFRVNSNAQPAFRLPRFQVNLVTAQTAGLYGSWAGLQIGDRIRITNIPAGVTGASQVDLIFEGCLEQSTRPNGVTSYMLTIDTSPADNPAWGIWDSTSYGRWMPEDGALTLNTTVTSSGTTIVLATASPTPAMSTSAGDYPANITIGTEDITLGSAPGGSTSPQTFTGCTRGVNGTFKAAHTSGDVVYLSPGSTWAPG